MIDVAYRILFTVALAYLMGLMGAMLVRSVKGPRITDRILSINMIGTLVISSIAILSVLLSEPYLVDVALIYGMISFVSVLILAMVYIPAHPGRDKFFRSGEKKVSDGTDTSIRFGRKGGGRS